VIREEPGSNREESTTLPLTRTHVRNGANRTIIPLGVPPTTEAIREPLTVKPGRY
jgi:hypothetical protein